MIKGFYSAVSCLIYLIKHYKFYTQLLQQQKKNQRLKKHFKMCFYHLRVKLLILKFLT